LLISETAGKFVTNLAQSLL